MRIAQIYETGLAQPGTSVGYVVLELSKHLSKLGCDVTLIERGQESNPYSESIGIRVIQAKVRKIASIPYRDVKSPVD
jgi:pyruvate/2-oxoglutarate dehydrogenase complex dihydrolipoamide dehydrogenase (E3) component